MLLRLADERATGALLRDRGTLYLLDGKVVHAESPASPGIEVLLTMAGRLRPEEWRQAVSEAGALGRVGRFLVDSGRVSGGELELCHLGALYDAAYFVLAPDSGPTRFRHGVAHWIGPVRPVPVAVVDRESQRRRKLLDRIWPHQETDTAPVLRTAAGHRGGTPVTPRQRAVLDLADGEHTAPDIARALGRAAFHTLLDVRRLAAAGALEAPRTPAPTALPDQLSMPVRVAAECAATETDIALLRRLRDALEAL
ncbi:transcriptional regulator [Streptomyces sp. H27-C3]|uniref:transcriptional regulator n=1 Tax=Streptomyces sp. H27-C3 TaxID=3046305 RepID=UPI0024BB3441|nr:transcriptional regulator [Streptomyces sp. H27-C3]MDJ0460391.1 transcriptional regulator [Streptomyces sp. H27-C3]